MLLIDAALDLASRGLPVFPARPRGKAPAFTGVGCYQATCDEQQIREWWRERPDANIAIGIPKGLLVVDIDGETARKYFFELEERQRTPLPTTWEALSGRLGLHIYLRIPEDYSPGNGKLWTEPRESAAGGPRSGIDLRSAGGVIIAPPSIHENGNCYDWIYSYRDGLAQPGEAPKWLLDEIDRVNARSKAPDLADEQSIAEARERLKLSLRSRRQSVRERYAEQALAGEVGRLLNAEVSERNITLNRAAFSLATLAQEGVLDRETCYGALSAAARQVGLGDEIDKTFESGWSSGLEAGPRVLPAQVAAGAGRPDAKVITFQSEPVRNALPSPFELDLATPATTAATRTATPVAEAPANIIRFPGSRSDGGGGAGGGGAEPPQPPGGGDGGEGGGGDSGDGGDDPPVDPWEDDIERVERGNRWWSFGASCVWCDEGRRGFDEPEEFARYVVPFAVAVDETGDHVAIRYRDRMKRVRETLVDVRGGASKSAANRVAEELMSKGVQIVPDCGDVFVHAVIHWSSDERPRVLHSPKPGWCGKQAYCNGLETYGVGDERVVYTGPEERKTRAGSLAEWQDGIRELGTTPAIQLALAAAFAGPLVAKLGIENFVVNLVGASSQGKTLAAALGAAVWYSPKHMLKWSATPNAIELATQSANDALLVLDELKLADRAAVARVAHTIADGRTRARAQRTGKALVQGVTWSLVGLSTAEFSASEYVGVDWQGGHGVRLIDLRLQYGDACKTAEHAGKVEEFLTAQYGHAGDAWARYLTTLDAKAWKALGERLRRLRAIIRPATEPELGRITDKLAVLAIALIEASRAGIVHYDEEAGAALLGWAVSRVRAERGEATDPNERAWRALLELVETEPARFPTLAQLTERPGRDIVGIWAPQALEQAPDRKFATPSKVEIECLTTSKQMLSASGILVRCGVSTQSFIDWLIATGKAVRTPRTRYGQIQKRWIQFVPGELDKEPAG